MWGTAKWEGVSIPVEGRYSWNRHLAIILANRFKKSENFCEFLLAKRPPKWLV